MHGLSIHRINKMNSLQRRKEKRAWYRINSERINADEYGQGIFCTPYILDGWSSWTDFRFLGVYEDKKVVYSVAMQNLYSAYYHAVEDLSLDQMTEKFPVPDDWNPLSAKRSRSENNQNEKDDEIISSSYYDRDEYNWHHENVKRLMDSGDIKVGELIELHPEYKKSIGLWCNVNYDFITPENMIQFIKEFEKSGYKPYEGPKDFSVTWKEFDEHHKKIKRVF